MPGTQPSPSAPDRRGLRPLSSAARRRLARPSPPPLRPPDLADPDAVGRWRAEVHAAWLDGDPPPEACGHRPETVADVPVLRAGAATEMPREAGRGVDQADDDRPLVIYCHGGGYALGSAAVAVPITERLAVGAEVVSVDYRLAPEHPCPAAVEDVTAVTDAVAAGLDRRRALVLAGDSAGANLALSIALARPVDGLLLLSPHLDHGDIVAPVGPRPAEDLDQDGRDWLRRAYCGDLDPTDLRCSPLRADPTGLPPTLVQVGSVDTALGHGARFTHRAQGRGVGAELQVWDGLWHTWHYHRDLPEADDALAQAVDFLGRLVPREPLPGQEDRGSRS